MSYEERKKALRYLLFLKEKCDDSIKVRGCAETSSPMVSLEAIMCSCAIDAKEGRHIAVTDIPGAFLQADMDQNVHMLLEVTIAELIVKLEPKLYRNYIWRNKNDKPMFYVKLRKALYGTLQVALLLWKLPSTTLTDWGFKINDYDQCVENKTINGKQCTIIWHVDDLKISHVDKIVVEDILKLLNDKFGRESPLTTTRGKVLEYLGMTLDYLTKGKVKISMYEYLDKLLVESPSYMNGSVKRPVASHLYNVDKEADKLPEEMAQLFHHLVAKVLYLLHRTRQDI